VTIAIRPWTSTDLEDVRRILWETWVDAYLQFIPREDLESYFGQHYTVWTLTEMLKDPDVVGYIALLNGSPSGMMKTYHNRSEGRLYVHQLYMLPSAQGHGLGRRLMAIAGDRAKALGFDSVWLGVMVKNTLAVSWYQAMGFTVTEQAPFTMGKTTVDHYIGYVPIARLATPYSTGSDHQ
jgi:ribosomal protein S18 acetylase RimI-like enzyme